MKVGISYAVELEDIPEEVENLLRDVQWDLRGKLEEIIMQIRSGDFSNLEVEIKTLRQNLLRVDTRMEDCYKILVGYVQVLNRLTEATAQGMEVTEASSPITPAPTDIYDPND